MRSIILLLAIVPNAFCQIVFNSSDYPQTPGTIFHLGYQTDYVGFDYGSPGGNQTWDFQDFQASDTSESEILYSDNTPFYSSFKDSEYSFYIDDPSVQVYSYYSVRNDSLILYGNVNDLPYGTMLIQYTPPSLSRVFPTQMGSEWIEIISYTFLNTQNMDSIFCSVDAWGTVILPGDHYYEALRFSSISHNWEDSGSGFVQDSRYFRYIWISPGYDYVVKASWSNMEEPAGDPNTISFKTSYSTDVKHGHNDSNDIKYTLHNPFPNPCNENTVISYILNNKSYVDLTVYNSAGQKVTSLLKGFSIEGEHSILWDTSSYSSGVYYTKLSADGYVDCKRVVVLK